MPCALFMSTKATDLTVSGKVTYKTDGKNNILDI